MTSVTIACADEVVCRVFEHAARHSSQPARPVSFATSTGRAALDSGGCAVTGRQLRELDEHVAGRRRIDEGDARPAVTDAWRLVAQFDALGPQLVERAVDVFHLEADVEEAGTMVAHPLRHAGLGPGALQQ